MPATIAEQRYYACSDAEQRYYACTDAVNRASGFPSLQQVYRIHQHNSNTNLFYLISELCLSPKICFVQRGKSIIYVKAGQ
jgi:hypothetical protein